MSHESQLLLYVLQVEGIYRIFRESADLAAHPKAALENHRPPSRELPMLQAPDGFLSAGMPFSRFSRPPQPGLWEHAVHAWPIGPPGFQAEAEEKGHISLAAHNSWRQRPENGMAVPRRRLSGDQMQRQYCQKRFGRQQSPNAPNVPLIRKPVISAKPPEASGKTTLKLQNIPDGWSAVQVADLLDDHGLTGCYDFFFKASYHF